VMRTVLPVMLCCCANGDADELPDPERTGNIGVRGALIIRSSSNNLIGMSNNVEVTRLDSLLVFYPWWTRATSKQLGLSPSTVSEKIAYFEQQLGVPLLTRTPRSVVPTEAGRVLAARMDPLLAEARAALQDAVNSQAEVRGLLRLNVTDAVMIDILPPLLDRFLNLHPHVRVEIVVEDGLVDIVARDATLASAMVSIWPRT